MKRCHIRVSTRKTARTIKSPYTFGVIRDESPKATPGERLEALDNKDVFYVFPAKNSRTTTVLVLKTPKTDGSSRKVFLPKTVAEHSSITYKLK